MMIKRNMKIVLLNIFYQKFASYGKNCNFTTENKRISTNLNHKETIYYTENKYSYRETISYSFCYNGKEKDYESGFHYYGARYYNSELSVWLSTDPMADKYPSLTPYNYCANNPVKLIDPNGMEIDPASKKQWKQIYSAILGQRNTLKPNKENKRQIEAYNKVLSLMNKLKTSTQMYSLNENSEINRTELINKNENYVIQIDFINMSKDPENNYDISGFVHELKHCEQFENGDIGFNKSSGLGVAVDIFDEVEAYEFQKTYDPSSLPNELNDGITPDNIRKIKEPNYRKLQNIKVNKNTIGKDGRTLRENSDNYFK